MNIALIGYGYWGKILFSNLLKFKNINLNTVVDNNLDLKFPFKINFCSDYKEVLKKDPFLEAVFIATPASTHYEIIKFFLDKKIKVVVEKPTTTSIKQTEELLNIAKNNGTLLMTDYTYMHNDHIKFIKKYIDKGKLGNILYINFDRSNLGPIRSDVGVLRDLASHDLAILNFLTNKNHSSIVVSSFKTQASNNEEVLNISIKYKSFLVNIFASWLHPEKTRTIKIVGDKKMIIYDELNLNEPIKIFDKKISDINEKIQTGTSIFNFSTGNTTSPYVTTKSPVENMIDSFLQLSKKTNPDYKDLYKKIYKIEKDISEIDKLI